jgi:hypothetical protein
MGAKPRSAAAWRVADLLPPIGIVAVKQFPDGDD